MSGRVLDPEILKQLGGSLGRAVGRRSRQPKAPGVCLADSFRVVTDPVTIRLPFPPMLNHYWRSCVFQKHVKVYISAEGKAYRQHVVEEWPRQVGRVTFSGLLVVRLELVFPDNRDRDLDGCPKGLLDALEHAGAYRNDSQIKRLLVDQSRVEKPGWVDVTIGPKPGVDRQSTMFGMDWW